MQADAIARFMPVTPSRERASQPGEANPHPCFFPFRSTPSGKAPPRRRPDTTLRQSAGVQLPATGPPTQPRRPGPGQQASGKIGRHTGRNHFPQKPAQRKMKHIMHPAHQDACRTYRCHSYRQSDSERGPSSIDRMRYRQSYGQQHHVRDGVGELLVDPPIPRKTVVPGPVSI